MGGSTFADTRGLATTRAIVALRQCKTPVTLHGKRLLMHHATTTDAESTAPLVLLHGMASSWRQWRTTMLRIGAELPIAALDLPGFGDSARPRRRLLAGDFADAAEAWCRVRGWPPLAAVGHSFGGAVLIDWAGRYPERFRSIGLVAPAAVFHHWYTSGYGFLRWPVLGPLLTAPALWLISTRTLGRRVFGHIASDLAAVAPDEMGDLQWGCRRAREMRRALDYYRFPNLTDHLGCIRCPVTVGWGTHDRVVPYSDAPAYMAHLPHAHLHTWEACGHVPMLERRSAFDDLLREVWAASSRD